MRKSARGNASPSPWPPPSGGALIACFLGISLLLLREWCSTPDMGLGTGFLTKQTIPRTTQEGFGQLLSSGLSQLAQGATQFEPQAFYTLITGCSQLLRWGLMPVYNLCAPCFCITLIDEILAFLLPGRMERKTGHLFRKHGVSTLITLIADLPATLSITDVALFLSKTVCAATTGFSLLMCSLMVALGFQLYAFIMRPLRCIRHTSTGHLLVRLLALVTITASLASLACWLLATNSQQTLSPGGWGVSLHPHNVFLPVLRYSYHGIKSTMSTNDVTTSLDANAAPGGAPRLADATLAGIFGSFAFLQKSKSQHSLPKMKSNCQFSNPVYGYGGLNGFSGDRPLSQENRQFSRFYNSESKSVTVYGFTNPGSALKITLITGIAILLLTQGPRVREAFRLISSTQDARKTLWSTLLAQAAASPADKISVDAPKNAVGDYMITKYTGAMLVGAHHLFVALYLTSLFNTLRWVLISHGLAIAITYAHYRIILGCFGIYDPVDRRPSDPNILTTPSYSASKNTFTPSFFTESPLMDGESHTGTSFDNMEAGITPPPSPPQSPNLAPKTDDYNLKRLQRRGLRGGTAGHQNDSSDSSSSDSDSNEGAKGNHIGDSGGLVGPVDWRFGVGAPPINLGPDFLKECLRWLLNIINTEYDGVLPEDQAQQRQALVSTMLSKVAGLLIELLSSASTDNTDGAAKFSLPRDSRDHAQLNKRLSTEGKIVKVCCVSSKHIGQQDLFRALNDLGITLLSQQASTTIRSSRPGALTPHQQHSIMAQNDEHLHRLLRGETRLWIGDMMLYVYLLPQEHSSVKEIQIRSHIGADPRHTLIVTLWALGVPLAVISDILLFCVRLAGIPADFLRIQTLKRVMHPQRRTMTCFESINPWDPDAHWTLQFAADEDYEIAQTKLRQGNCTVQLLPNLRVLAAPTGGQPHSNAPFIDHSFTMVAHAQKSPLRGYGGGEAARPKTPSATPKAKPHLTAWFFFLPGNAPSSDGSNSDSHDFYLAMLKYVGLLLEAHGSWQGLAAHLTLALRDFSDIHSLTIGTLSFFRDDERDKWDDRLLNGIEIQCQSTQDMKKLIQTFNDRNADTLQGLIETLHRNTTRGSQGDRADSSDPTSGILDALKTKYDLRIVVQPVIEGPADAPRNAPPLPSSCLRSTPSEIFSRRRNKARKSKPSFAEVAQRSKKVKTQDEDTPGDSQSVEQPPQSPARSHNRPSSSTGKQPMRAGPSGSDATTGPSGPTLRYSEGGSSRGGSFSNDGPLVRTLVKSHQEACNELEKIKSKTASTPSMAEFSAMIQSVVEDQLQAVKEQVKSIVADQILPITARVNAQQEQLTKYDAWHDHLRGHIDGQIANMASAMEKQHLETSHNMEQITHNMEQIKMMLATAPRQTRSGISRSSSSSGGNQQGTGASAAPLTDTHTGESTAHRSGVNDNSN